MEPSELLTADEFRHRVRAVAEQELRPLIPAARKTGRFPKAALGAVGRAGLIDMRWTGGMHGNQVFGAIIAEELGRLGDGGIASCLGVQIEAVQAILRRYGASPELQQIQAQAARGERAVCLAFTEPGGGSDLNGMATIARRTETGWRVTGKKRYISLGSVADHALVLAKLPEEPKVLGNPALGLFLVDAVDIEITEILQKAGNEAMDTVAMTIDADLHPGRLVGRAGRGLVVANWGLLHERFGIAAASMGACTLAISLTAERFRRRRSFGVPLLTHQALRLDLAELHAKVLVQQAAIRGVAQNADLDGLAHHTVSALKVTSAGLAEKVLSECLQLFGGLGYLLDDAPIAGLWRDIRLARIAAGTDHMLLEIVGSNLPTVSDEDYRKLVREESTCVS